MARRGWLGRDWWFHGPEKLRSFEFDGMRGRDLGKIHKNAGERLLEVCSRLLFNCQRTFELAARLGRDRCDAFGGVEMNCPVEEDRVCRE